MTLIKEVNHSNIFDLDKHILLILTPCTSCRHGRRAAEGLLKLSTLGCGLQMMEVLSISDEYRVDVTRQKNKSSKNYSSPTSCWCCWRTQRRRPKRWTCATTIINIFLSIFRQATFRKRRTHTHRVHSALHGDDVLRERIVRTADGQDHRIEILGKWPSYVNQETPSKNFTRHKIGFKTSFSPPFQTNFRLFFRKMYGLTLNLSKIFTIWPGHRHLKVPYRTGAQLWWSWNSKLQVKTAHL